MSAKAHWECVYQQKEPAEVSWYQSHAAISLAMIERAVRDHSAPIMDVGGGASTLVDDLLRTGYEDLTVLDLAGSALVTARARVLAAGLPADRVQWMEGDVLDARLPPAHYELWHDRAAFHFLLSADDRARYVSRVREVVRPGGAVLMATFAADGPLKCSGLDVARYSPEQLLTELGAGFRLVESQREEHETPWGARQSFTYCLCRLESLDA